MCSFVVRSCDSSASAGCALRISCRRVATSLESVERAHTSHALSCSALKTVIGLKPAHLRRRGVVRLLRLRRPALMAYPGMHRIDADPQPARDVPDRWPIFNHLFSCFGLELVRVTLPLISTSVVAVMYDSKVSTESGATHCSRMISRTSAP